MPVCFKGALLLSILMGLPTFAQDTKVDKTKAGVVSTNPDAGRQHIQITGGTPPSAGTSTSVVHPTNAADLSGLLADALKDEIAP